MDNNEAMYWLAILQQANEGSKEAMELLRQENELRTEMGQLMIQEELKALDGQSEIESSFITRRNAVILMILTINLVQK